MSIKTKMWANAVVFACAAILLSFAASTPTGTTYGDDAMNIRPNAVGSPAYLVEKHDCWTGDAPEGVEAGHVVVTKGNETVYSAKLVGEALAQLFAGEEHGLTVHGFCR